jgi:hypothetical protein
MKILIRAITILVIIFFVLGIGEVAARLWLNAHNNVKPNPAAVATPVVRKTAYEHSDYWSPEFEQEKHAAEESFKFSDHGFWQGNYHGRWFNFDDGFRHTTEQPSDPKHIVYVFGNSTLESMAVPDGDTIPSYLQKLFNMAFSSKYKVINVGSAAMNASLELARLKSLPVKQGDIVIFYDGVIDARDDAANMPDFRRSHSILGKACNWLEHSLRDLALGKVYCQWVDTSVPPRGQDPEDVTRAIADSKHYLDVVESANKASKAVGAQFYHILQPHLLSQSPLPHEKIILQDAPPEDISAIQLAWPLFQKSQRTLVAHGIQSWDFTHILDTARTNHSALYLDLTHVTEGANQIIARAMFDAITLI